MIEILTYISLITGGLLVLMLVTSIIGGLDWDIDLEGGDIDGGGIGYIKGGLTFFSIGSWVVKILLVTSIDPVIAFVGGIAAGAIAVYLLVIFMKFLLSQQSEVNWSPEDALFESGTVYLKIPPKGQGIVRVNMKGGNRELKARSKDGKEIPTGAKITVDAVEDHLVVVSQHNDELA